MVGIHALKKKGLRLSPFGSYLLLSCVGIHALKKKGLRLLARRKTSRQDERWNPCPEEEGIKTHLRISAISESAGWNPCPEEEGIKTPALHLRLHGGVGIHALKKKGLRPTTLSLPLGTRSWNPCPEEEGIKTYLPLPCPSHAELESMP